MTEEMKEPSKEAPKAIVLSVYIGAITGFIFLVSVSFCIGDITSTADSTTGVPLIQIFYDSTDSVVGACFLASLITVIVLVCANALLAEDLSYAMPLLVRIMAWCTGRARVLPGPYTLGSYGIFLNIIGFLFLLFASITFNFPTVNPVDQGNMNYTSAAIGVIGLISIVTWLATGRKNFTGPDTGARNGELDGRQIGVAGSEKGSEPI
ncbi:hypothetical protein MMC20_005471 [Loxospora ochrophaea]|nr:hypothetical protein [Loxospora ochrophaea]